MALRRTFTNRILRRAFHMSKEQQTISEILRQNKQRAIVGASSRDNLAGLVKLLQAHRVGAVPVFDMKKSGIVEDTKILQIEGIISERDVIRDLALSNVPLEEIKVSAAMTPKSRLIVVSDKTTAGEAVELMLQNNIRHLVVLEKANWTFTGIVSIKDVVHGAFYADEQTKAAEAAFNARAISLAGSW